MQMRPQQVTVIGSAGADVELSGIFHAQPLVRSLVVEFLDEAIEAALLLEEVFGRGMGRFPLERQMHALVAPVLLGVSRLDALDVDSEA